MDRSRDIKSHKIPEVTLAFWIIKIAATTLGETGGDALSMTMHLGYAISSVIFIALFFITVTPQVIAKSYHPFLYWSVIVATTTAGTTMADFADRSLGVGYPGGSLILFAVLLLVLGAWRLTVGSVSVVDIRSTRAEIFYWTTILFSNTLGTALGDWMADNPAIGYDGGALIFTAALALTAAAYFKTTLSHTLLFWSAFILTRPLGATLGDMLTKPVAGGGLHLGRISSSAIIALFMIGCILFASRQASGRPDGNTPAQR
jgi:uncharacterized membrane-anchored protein